MNEREQGREVLKELVKIFRENYAEYTRSSSSYNETLLRVDLINPLVEALGWDVNNKKGAPQHLREIVHEDNVLVDDDDRAMSKKPDYAFRLGSERKFFLEAKKPSVAIMTSDRSAFQVRRYGWNARLPISILTNFDKLAIYDCSYRPLPTDSSSVARLKIYSYKDYIESFDEIYDQISREAVYSGKFDETFRIDQSRTGTEPFDDFFLNQIEKWRRSIAEDLLVHNKSLNQDEMNFLLQRLINRIIFLRVCEDRNLEKYESLKNVRSYQDLKKLFIDADHRYNSGLFNFIEDEFSLNIEISNGVLIQVFRELYFPESPYVFSVIEAEVISEIYEIFLSKEVQLVRGERIKIVEKPEIIESNGVVSSPKYIVDTIVQKTIAPLCQGKTPTELSTMRIADIACGSGTFLLAAYEYLLNYHLEWYLSNGAEKYRDRVYEGRGGNWYLTLYEKQRILSKNLYGVDLDLQATEVTQFSLCLKILENENGATIKANLDRYQTRALPNLSENIQWGNSLIDPDTYQQFDQEIITSSEKFNKISPFDWTRSFPHIMKNGGFDVIIGNPPYIRTQNMVKYLPEEVLYYRSHFSPYTTAKSDNFDKYALFIEKSLSLLKPYGVLGYIIPNRFFKTKAGTLLRQLIVSQKCLAEIVDFGVQQVFAKQTTTYTCIVILRKIISQQILVEYVTDLQKWRYGENQRRIAYNADDFDLNPWRLLPPQVDDFFGRLEIENALRLGEIYDVFVGLQTSDDKVYIFTPEQETEDRITFKDINKILWTIEKDIVRPCLYDSRVPAFATPRSNAWIIFPYHIETITQKNGKTVQRGILYTENEMQKQFPACWEYLNAHKSRLDPNALNKHKFTRRSVQGYTADTWYRYGRSQSLTMFDGQPKLIWSTLSLNARYAYDSKNILFTGGGNGPYYALRQQAGFNYSLFYVQAILHHPVFESIIYAGTVRVRGDYSSRGKQYIENIPIRMIDNENKDDLERYNRIIILVKQLISVIEELSQARLPKIRIPLERQTALLRRQINELIEQLYGIGKEDLQLVEDLKKMSETSDLDERGLSS